MTTTRIMAALHDRTGLPRAFGIADTHEAAEARAREELTAYLAEAISQPDKDPADYELRYSLVPGPEGDPREAQLVTTNKVEDYLPATPQRAVDQAHGMVLAHLIDEGRANSPALRIEAAQLLAEAATAYIDVVRRAHR